MNNIEDYTLNFNRSMIVCQFPIVLVLVEFVTFLGHVMLKDRIMVNLMNIEKVYDWIRTTSPIDIQSFIGLIGYYR